MELKVHPAVNTDILVLGSGGAGLRAAIEARKHGASVLLVSKSRIGLGSNTTMSGTGISAGTGWRDPADTPETHFKDTIIGGRYLSNQRLAEVLTRNSGQEILKLEKFGVKFRKRGEAFHMALMAGHSHPRNVFGDKTIGTSLTLPLRDYAVNAGIQMKEGVLITKLLTKGKAVVGAIGIDNDGGVHVFNARAIILATGGAGHMYLRTSNAAGSTGDGYVLAYDLGVPLIDMEFVQFSMTGPNVEMFCAREGAVIRNAVGDNILQNYGITEPVKMTRDAVTRAIMTEILGGRSRDGHSLTLDTTPISKERFETLRTLLPKNAPPDQRYFDVGVQQHFCMGGLKTNENTETGIERLFAAGEVCGGVHGASRLGGNALAEIFVFGKIAGEQAAQTALASGTVSPESKEVSAEVERLNKLGSAGTENIQELQRSLKTTMWNKAAVIRNEKGLKEAIEEIASVKSRFQKAAVGSYKELCEAVRLGNMLVVADMVVRAALLRTESRGSHYRSDYPMENNKEWLKNTVISKKNGQMSLSTTPVDLSKMVP